MTIENLLTANSSFVLSTTKHKKQEE